MAGGFFRNRAIDILESRSTHTSAPHRETCDSVGLSAEQHGRKLCYASAFGLGSHNHTPRSPQKWRAINVHAKKTRALNAPLRFDSDHASGEPSPYNLQLFESKRDAIDNGNPADDPLPRMRQLPRLRQIHGEEREWLLCPFTTMSVFRLSSNPWCLLLRQEWIGVNATNKADQSEDCAPWRRLAYCQEFRRPARMCDRSRRVYSADAGVRGCHIGEGAVLAG